MYTRGGILYLLTKCLITATAVIVSAAYTQANNYLFYTQLQNNKEHTVHTKIRGYKNIGLFQNPDRLSKILFL